MARKRKFTVGPAVCHECKARVGYQYKQGWFDWDKPTRKHSCLDKPKDNLRSLHEAVAEYRERLAEGKIPGI